MSTAKDEVRKLLDRLPDDATWEDVRQQLALRQKIEEARREVAAGDTLSTEEVESRLAKWLEP